MIEGIVKGQTLRLISPLIASDTVDYLEAEFVFRQRDWDGLSVIKAVFSSGGTAHAIPLTDGRIRREDHLNLTAGTWTVHLVGSEYVDGRLVQRITTAPDTLTVVPCGAMDGEPLPEMPATDAERLEARMDVVEQKLASGGGGGTGTDKYVESYRIVSNEEKNTHTLVLIYNDKTELSILLPQMGIDINRVVQFGVVDPDGNTPGETKQLYVNTNTGRMWVCKSGTVRPVNWIQIAGGGAVNVDKTLTVSGAAADAAVVGERVKELSEAIRGQGKQIPKVFPWAVAELPFTAAQISGTVSGAGFVVNPTNFDDGKTYFRYHAGATNFIWTNPNPKVGAVTITARGYAQYGGNGSTRLLTYYDDGTAGPILWIVQNGEPQTVTVTTDPAKTLARITGNYDMENWVLLDLDVLSIVADYPAPTGTVKTVNGVEPDENGNVQIELPEGNATSWDDLTDKPFGLTPGKYYIEPVEIDTSDSSRVTVPVDPAVWGEFTEPTDLTLILNGVEYRIRSEKIYIFDAYTEMTYEAEPETGYVYGDIVWYAGGDTATISTREGGLLQGTFALKEPDTIKQIDPEFLPDFPEPVQPDWNQNDVSADDYVRNRPFYTDYTYLEFVGEATVTTEPVQYVFIDALMEYNEPEIGVMWDGVMYRCPCSVNQDSGYYNFGDGYLEKYPFYFNATYGNGQILGDEGTHTYSLHKPTEVVHTIQEKYMPTLISPSGKRFKLAVDDTGALSATEITE